MSFKKKLLFAQEEPGDPPELYLDPYRDKIAEGSTSLVAKLPESENVRLYHIFNHNPKMNIDDYFLPGTRYVRKWVYGQTHVADQRGVELHPNEQLIHEIAMHEKVTGLFTRSHQSSPGNKLKNIYIVPLLQWVIMLHKRDRKSEEFEAFDELSRDGQSIRRKMYDTMTAFAVPKAQQYDVEYDAQIEAEDNPRSVVHMLEKGFHCRSAYLTLPLLHDTLRAVLSRPVNVMGSSATARTIFRLCQEMLVTIRTLHYNLIVHGDIHLTNFLLGYDQNNEVHAYLADFGLTMDFSTAARAAHDRSYRAHRVYTDQVAYDIGGLAKVLCSMFKVVASWYDYMETKPDIESHFVDEFTFHDQKHGGKISYSVSDSKIESFSLQKVAEVIHNEFTKLIYNIGDKEYKSDLKSWWPGTL
jgi:serine/threonine protein kinase